MRSIWKCKCFSDVIAASYLTDCRESVSSGCSSRVCVDVCECVRDLEVGGGGYVHVNLCVSECIV